MPRKPKAKCQHENSPVSLSGCAYCVQDLIQARHVMRILGLTPTQVVAVLRHHYPTQQSLFTAAARLDAEWAKKCAATKGGDDGEA